jgi:hypothetical protein
VIVVDFIFTEECCMNIKVLLGVVLIIGIGLSGCGQSAKDFEYEISGGTVTITGYRGRTRRVSIPGLIDRLPVTVIGDQAFLNKQLTRVTIPDSVTTIRREAFFDNRLSQVIIPDSVTVIGDWAFARNSLTSVIISNSITSIGDWAFAKNSLVGVITLDLATAMFQDNPWAALRNKQLTSVIIPDSMTTIGKGVFAENQITDVLIPDSVTFIGSSAFQPNPPGNTPLYISRREDMEWLIRENRLTSITIGADVMLYSEPYAPFPGRFATAYENADKQAGTYIRNTMVYPHEWNIVVVSD